LEKITVVPRLVTLSRVRKWSMSLLVVAPRMCITVSLGIIGSWYLSLGISQEDLILNVVALAFVVSLDEELYRCFIPRRLHTAVANLEPLLVTQCRMLPSVTVMSKLLFIAGAVIVAYAALVQPFFEKVFLAQDILCSGERDFVYAVNPASEVVHVARGRARSTTSGWSATETAIFQIAQPRVYDKSYHQLRESGGLSNVTRAVVLPSNTSFESSRFRENSFETLMAMTAYSVSDGAEELACEDLQAGPSWEASLMELRSVMGDDSITSCSDDLASAVQLCADMNMSRFRALCPETCGCNDFASGFDDVTGWPATIFGCSVFGCPDSCKHVRTAISQWLFQSQTGIGANCTDVPQEALTHPEVDFELSRWFSGYLTGLHSMLKQDTRFVEDLWSRTHLMNEGTGAMQWNYIVSGDFLDALLNGDWHLSPGVPHPRNLEGCAFLASYEFTLLIGLDLCWTTEVRNIRNICPVSCRCGTMEGCPVRCFVDEG